MQIAGKGGVVVAGSATRDADFKRVGSKDTPFCTFGLAVGRDENDNPAYANIKAWRDLAEYAAGIKKGTPVFVAGRIEEHEYNGETRRAVVADYLVFLPPLVALGDADFTPVEDDGELPF